MLSEPQPFDCAIPPEHARVIRILAREFHGEFALPDIEDAVDAGYEKWFERAWCGAAGLEKSRAAYVFHCARNHLLKLLRRKAHELPLSEVTWELMTCDDTETGPNAEGDVRYLLSSLPKPWKRVMQLFWIEGFEIAEIAELMQRSKGAIYHIKEKAEKRCLELGIKNLGYAPQQEPRQTNLKVNRKI